MSLVYYFLDKVPAIYAEDMQEEYELLTLELVKSGLIRIDTDYYSNFIYYYDSNTGFKFVFSKDEILEPSLLEKTRNTIRKNYQRKEKFVDDSKVEAVISILYKKVKKLNPVNIELQLMLTRLFVQAAHPIVIRWLIICKVEIFITYSNIIGDIMDIQNWKNSGSNSGMQSINGEKIRIYVSCGGDPFAKNNKENSKQGDGWAALARLQIIAAQEIGHFADIKRDLNGKSLAVRYSADMACRRANEYIKLSRNNDIYRCDNLLTFLLKNRMDKLIALEKELKFYHNHKLVNLKVIFISMLVKFYRYRLLKLAKDHKLYFILRFKKDKYLGLLIKLIIDDMKMNLTPTADVYKRDNKEAEEAISCVESLARVPQQVIKWGYLTTQTVMHDLYKVYYGEIIPDLIKSYSNISKQQYSRNYLIKEKNFIKKIFSLFRFKNYSKKICFTQVRDI